MAQKVASELQGGAASTQMVVPAAWVEFMYSVVRRSSATGVVSKYTPPPFLTPLTVTCRMVPSHSGRDQMTSLTSSDVNRLQQSATPATHGFSDTTKHMG